MGVRRITLGSPRRDHIRRQEMSLHANIRRRPRYADRRFSPSGSAILDVIFLARGFSRSRPHATTHSLLPAALVSASHSMQVSDARGRSPHAHDREAWMVSDRPNRTTTLAGPPEQREMTDRFRTARWSRFVVAFCLITTSASARSQEDEPLDDHNSPDRSSGSLPGQKPRQKPQTEEPTPPRQEASRWQRFRESVWPFRSKRQTADSGRPTRNAPLGNGQPSADAKNRAEEASARGTRPNPEPSPRRAEKRRAGSWDGM